MPFILLLFIFGYMEGSLASYIFLFIPCIAAMFIQLPLYSSMLISGGRKERFVTTMIVVFAITVLSTTAVTILAALTIPMAEIMPEILLSKLTITFHAADLRMLFIPLLIIPIGLILMTIFYRQLLHAMVFVMFMFFFVTSISKELSSIISIFPIIVMIILSWLALTAVVWHICTKRSLVGRGH
jgi:hypothetical protein